MMEGIGLPYAYDHSTYSTIYDAWYDSVYIPVTAESTEDKSAG